MSDDTAPETTDITLSAYDEPNAPYFEDALPVLDANGFPPDTPSLPDDQDSSSDFGDGAKKADW